MRLIPRCALAAALVTAIASPVVAQQPAPAAAPTGLVGDLLTDLGHVEKKIMGLANAIPADKCSWRPATGVRSVCEVLLHIAADNYLLPGLQGHAIDASLGIKPDDYKTVQAFETRALSREATIAELERSFAFLRKSLTATDASKLPNTISAFGQTMTSQFLWISTATHLHEHLGQLIAYARTNGVKPPWGQG